MGCTDLEENILDEVENEDDLLEIIGDNPALGSSLVASAYNRLIPAFTERRVFNLQEVPTDEVIVPTRNPGGDWNDAGRYIALHTHAWTPNNASVVEVWDDLMAGLAAALQAQRLLENPQLDFDNENVLIAEAKGLVAFYAYTVLDLYGQVPFIDEDGISVVLSPEKAVATIQALLEEAVPDLSTKNEAAGPQVFTQAAAQGLLARLHMNKAVFLDRGSNNFNFSTEDLDQVIAYTTDVIDDGGYSLSEDYFALFDVDNDANTATDELIFVADQIAGIQGNSAFITITLSQGMYAGDGGSFRGWNGFATLPEFLATWEEEDPRYFKENYPNEPGTLDPALYELNRGFQVGIQHGPVPVDENDNPTEGGTFRRDGEGFLVIEVLRNFLRDNQVINFTPEVSLNDTQEAGARVFKYEFATNGPGRWDTDLNIPLMRLAEMYLMRAEAKLRKGDAAGAQTDINTVRLARDGGIMLGQAPGLDEMLDELGFEFYWEMHRRTDLVRFGKFQESWTEKPASNDANKRIFPIPTNAVNANPNLFQNPGY